MNRLEWNCGLRPAFTACNGSLNACLAQPGLMPRLANRASLGFVGIAFLMEESLLIC